MITKSAYVARIIRRLLTIGIVLLLMPTPDAATARFPEPDFLRFHNLFIYGGPLHPNYNRYAPLIASPYVGPHSFPRVATASEKNRSLMDIHFGIIRHRPFGPVYQKRTALKIWHGPLLTPAPPLPVPVKRNGGPTLMQAAWEGRFEVVKRLLEKGADVDAKQGNGRTAFMNAAERGHLELAKLLLDSGADINAKDQLGWTALLWAVSRNQTDMVKLLLDKGADVNAKEERGLTALLWAVSRNQTDIVKLLLDKGADVNVRDERGWTPLMDAVNWNHPEAVKLLLDKGADVNLKHQYGWTALSIAKGKGNKEIEKLLRTRGAKK